MDRSAGVDEDGNEPGRRLERYIKARWPRSKGGMRGLAVELQSSTETMYAWFRGDSEPSMAHLRALADKLGVRRAVLVAVLDGDPLPGEEGTQDLAERLRTVEVGLAFLNRQVVSASIAPAAPQGKVG